MQNRGSQDAKFAKSPPNQLASAKEPRLACVAGQTVKQYATWDKYGDSAYAVTCAVNKCNDKHRNLGIP